MTATLVLSTVFADAISAVYRIGQRLEADIQARNGRGVSQCERELYLQCQGAVFQMSAARASFMTV